jgi:hypothetical protein
VPGLAGYLTMSLAGVGLSRRKPPVIACIAAVFLTAAKLHCLSAFAKVKLRLSRKTLSGGAALSRSPFKISLMRKGNPKSNRLQKTTVFSLFASPQEPTLLHRQRQWLIKNSTHPLLNRLLSNFGLITATGMNCTGNA